VNTEVAEAMRDESADDRGRKIHSWIRSAQGVSAGAGGGSGLQRKRGKVRIPLGQLGPASLEADRSGSNSYKQKNKWVVEVGETERVQGPKKKASS